MEIGRVDVPGDGLAIKISYFPIYEVVTFGVTFSSLIVARFVTELNNWLVLFLILVAYFVMLGGSKIIRLNRDRLKIISLNPFFRSHLIKTKSIIEINSSERSTFDTVISGEMYYIFNKKYNLEYVSGKGKRQKVIFSIHNQKKEKILLEALKASYTKPK